MGGWVGRSVGDGRMGEHHLSSGLQVSAREGGEEGGCLGGWVGGWGGGVGGVQMDLRPSLQGLEVGGEEVGGWMVWRGGAPVPERAPPCFKPVSADGERKQPARSKHSAQPASTRLCHRQSKLARRAWLTGLGINPVPTCGTKTPGATTSYIAFQKLTSTQPTGVMGRFGSVSDGVRDRTPRQNRRLLN